MSVMAPRARVDETVIGVRVAAWAHAMVADAPHTTKTGAMAACSLPEFPHVEKMPIDFTEAARGCRPCMAALVALAVNRPNVVGTDRGGNEVLAPAAALLTVREHLDECDPLRVRAEQELVPLVERYAA